MAFATVTSGHVILPTTVTYSSFRRQFNSSSHHTSVSIPSTTAIRRSRSCSLFLGTSLLLTDKIRRRRISRFSPSPISTCALSAAVDSKPTILITEKLGSAGLDFLRSHANVDCSYNLSTEEICAKISLCDALIVRSGTKVTREVFEASNGRLKVVGRAGVGIDNVDLQAATEHGCLVVNAPTANTIAAAEHGIALMISMARNVAQADASLKAGKFPV